MRGLWVRSCRTANRAGHNEVKDRGVRETRGKSRAAVIACGGVTSSAVILKVATCLVRQNRRHGRRVAGRGPSGPGGRTARHTKVVIIGVVEACKTVCL